MWPIIIQSGQNAAYQMQDMSQEESFLYLKIVPAAHWPGRDHRRVAVEFMNTLEEQ